MAAVSPSTLRGVALLGLVAVAAMGCGLDQGDLSVRVLDARTQVAIASARVTVDGYRELTTNGAGFARTALPAGMHAVVIEHDAYTPVEEMIRLQPREQASRTVRLLPKAEPSPGPSPSPGPAPSGEPTPAPSGVPSAVPSAEARVELFGRVTDDAGTRLAGAIVFVESPLGLPHGSASTNAQGEYHVRDLPGGQALRVTALADGRRSISRTVKPSGVWRLDFTGAYGLKPPAPPPSEHVRVVGRVENAAGQALDQAIVRVETYRSRAPWQGTAIAKDGAYELSVPSGAQLRFTATQAGHRPISFLETVRGAQARVDFTGARSLVPASSVEIRGEEN